MSLWWVQKGQLDKHQIALIENLPLRTNALVVGPPGSGKTNVLLRRAQFVRGQQMPNVMLLTFTRPLAEFIKTGCQDVQGREIFPRACVSTLESWQRWLYKQHQAQLPTPGEQLIDWKRQLAERALDFQRLRRVPKYDALFVDEAQDLLPEEVALLANWSDVLFFVGDDRQRIYGNTRGLAAIEATIPKVARKLLPFHYRMAPEICDVADRILQPEGDDNLSSMQHYLGPKPAQVNVVPAPLTKTEQLSRVADRLKEQIRVYADLIRQGDKLGIITARKADRALVLAHLENDAILKGKAQIVRARDEDDDGYDPTIDPAVPICILTVKGCKGLEFRALHWLFADELEQHHSAEHYYTVVTRAKTSLDISYTTALPQILARAHSAGGVIPW